MTRDELIDEVAETMSGFPIRLRSNCPLYREDGSLFEISEMVSKKSDNLADAARIVDRYLLGRIDVNAEPNGG